MSEDASRDLVPVLDREEQKLEPPKKYKVVLLNDDFTPMDFVVNLLVQMFGKRQDQANRIMVEVHQKGKGIAGIYSHEIAETKARIACEFAQSAGYPLKADTEPE